MNEYIEAERTNRFRAAKMKKDAMDFIGWQIKTIDKILLPAIYTFNWYVKNGRTDPDNITFASKFLFDSLQEQGKLENDGFKQVLAINHTFTIDPDERVEVVYNYRYEA